MGARFAPAGTKPAAEPPASPRSLKRAGSRPGATRPAFTPPRPARGPASAGPSPAAKIQIFLNNNPKGYY